jgi:integrase
MKKSQKNELIKRKFFRFLRQNKGYKESTIYQHERTILLWQKFNNNEDFTSFGLRRIEEFKHWLKEKENRRNGTLRLTYRYHVLRLLKHFFDWLILQPGYKSRINVSNIEALSLPMGETYQARHPQRKVPPSTEEIKKVIESIRIETEIDKRDRAIICYAWLTGARISAIYSIPMQAFDPDKLIVYQSPQLDVKTKFSKNICTAFFPIGYELAKEYFLEWVKFLSEEKKFGPKDPIFPKEVIENGEENISFACTGRVEPAYWSGPEPIRAIFEKRFREAGVPYHNPHSIRHMIVHEFSKIQLTEEEKKAISQNLGHENVGTTFGSYGYYHIPDERSVEIVQNINLEKRKLKETDQITLHQMLGKLGEYLEQKKKQDGEAS